MPPAPPPPKQPDQWTVGERDRESLNRREDDDRPPRRRNEDDRLTRRRDDDDFDDRPRRRFRDDDWDDRPRRRKSSGTSRLGIVVGAVVLGIGVMVVLARVVDGFGGPIPDSKWVAFEEPNRVKISIPGTPQRKTEGVNGGQMVMHLVEVSRNCAFIVGYSEGPIVQGVNAEALLDDACTEGMKGMAGKLKCVETQRESIQLNGVPGKQLTIDIENGRAKAFARFYLSRTRIYYLFAAGRDYHLEHPDVKRFFDSFEMLEQRPQAVLKQDPIRRPKP